MNGAGFTVEPAAPADCGEILRLIRALAEYEKLAGEVVASEDKLSRWLFSERPAAECLLARSAGRPVGFALFFHNFSTFRGAPGLYLEDLFVEPEYRGRGIGRTLLAHLAQLALERGCERLEWAVLDWNRPAWTFYASLGARPLSDWTLHRLSGEALRTLAQDGVRQR